jgi:hypothetical protein
MTAIDVSRLDTGLLDAVVRLVRLVDAPTDARFLAPLVTREIVYRLFMGAQGSRLGHIVAIGGPTQRIVEAIERLGMTFTSYRVGYRNASHFTREYKRLFGATPMHGVEHLQGGGRESAGV